MCCCMRTLSSQVTKMMQKQKIDLYSWKPEDERAASAMAAEAAAKKLNPSQSRVVDPTEVDVVSDGVWGGERWGNAERNVGCHGRTEGSSHFCNLWLPDLMKAISIQS